MEENNPNQRESKVLKYFIVPLIAVGVYLGIIFLYRILGLPSDKEIIAFTGSYYERYGYWVVFIGALVEGALLINWYLPGSIVVAMGVIFAKQADLSVPLMLDLIILGFYSTALLNYALGRFGWYHVLLKLGLDAPLNKMKSKIEKRGLSLIFTSYIHPNIGALAATASGILHLSFKRFSLYSLISIIAWNTLWTVVFYFFGLVLLNHIKYLVVVGGVVMYFVFMRSFKEEKINIP